MVVQTNSGVNMDTKSLGQILFDMGERDEMRFFDKDTGKEYSLLGCMYTYKMETDKHTVDFSIREVKCGKQK